MTTTALLRFIGARVGWAMVAILGVCALTFVTIRIVADPIELIAGINRTPETIASLTEQLGLDKPIWEQFGIYVFGLAQGDLGTSTTSFLPVATEIGTRLPATIELLVIATLLATLVGVGLGVLAAARPASLIDRFSQFLVQAGSSLPPFWTGLLLSYFFFALLHIAPAPLGQLGPGVVTPSRVTGLLVVDSLLSANWAALGSALAHLVLPSLTLALVVLPSILQITRTTVIHVLESDFIRTARSLGLSNRKIYLSYALRASLVPIVNVVANTLGWAISGAVFVEVVFGWPGIGSYAVTAMQAADYQPVVGVVLVSAIAYVLAYSLADILSAIIDPRIALR